jgi:hypothetical protein
MLKLVTKKQEETMKGEVETREGEMSDRDHAMIYQ